jgi:hypothetical protein
MTAEPLIHLQENEKGEQTTVDYDDEAAVKTAIADCIAAAEKALPSQTVYEIRGKARPDDPINQERLQRKRRSREELAKNWGVAWYWTSAEPKDFGHYGGMKQEPLFRHPVWNAELAPFGGYIVIARLRTD